MPAPAPVADLTLTQPTADIPVGTLSWTHATPADVDRFMLGYKIGTEWTNLEPRPKAEYGAGPYSTSVPIRTDISWRVVAVNAANEVSA